MFCIALFRITDAEEMMSADKNITLLAKQCAKERCFESYELPECELYRSCLPDQYERLTYESN